MNLSPSASQEAFVCVDVETSGPYPGEYSLLSIGACTVLQPRHNFYAELKPLNDNRTPEAMRIHQLSLEQLKLNGEDPAQAISRFADWLVMHTPKNQRPIFVAFNAAFDWMFVAAYFYRYLGHNPFGHAALDIKAYAMGKLGIPWVETSMRYLGPRFQKGRPLSHHGLQDAIDQADLFLQLMEVSNGKG